MGMLNETDMLCFNTYAVGYSFWLTNTHNLSAYKTYRMATLDFYQNPGQYFQAC